MTEAELVRAISGGLIAVAAITFGLLFVGDAPYGRHARAGWGPTMPTRWAWVVMESPAVLLFAFVYAQGQYRAHPVPLILLILWQAHYLNRTFVYPWRMRGAGRPTPLVVVALGFAFQVANSYVNARTISELQVYAPAWLQDPRLWVGVGLFMVGRRINTWADGVLRALRARRSDAGYAIPHGGLYAWVSCPNYLGECIEWLGWAIAAWSL
ncbi:MAG: DUF1295 domain-containing protein, partial [Myxococcota bacterium]